MIPSGKKHVKNIDMSRWRKELNRLASNLINSAQFECRNEKSSSFHISGTPGKHQWLQSGTEGLSLQVPTCASLRNALIGVTCSSVTGIDMFLTVPIIASDIEFFCLPLTFDRGCFVTLQFWRAPLLNKCEQQNPSFSILQHIHYSLNSFNINWKLWMKDSTYQIMQLSVHRSGQNLLFKQILVRCSLLHSVGLITWDISTCTLVPSMTQSKQWISANNQNYNHLQWVDSKVRKNTRVRLELIALSAQDLQVTNAVL